MCLAVPAQLVEVNGTEALADLSGNRLTVSTLLTPEAVVGDWVLIHAGFAIQRIDCNAAMRTWGLLNDAAACSPRAETTQSPRDSHRSTDDAAETPFARTPGTRGGHEAMRD